MPHHREPEIHTLRLGDLFRASTPPTIIGAVTVIAVRTTIDPLNNAATASHWLSPHERHRSDEWMSQVRRRHWLAGRIAAKHASRAIGWELPPHQITIEARRKGSPLLTSTLGRRDLSITHSGEWAMACVCPQGWLLGLDYEIGADDRVHLAKRVCTPAQARRHHLQPEQNTQKIQGTFGAIWTLKEALLKAWRIGLVGDLDHIVVEHLPPNLDGAAKLSLATSISEAIPYPLDAGLWAGVTRWEGHPLSAVAVERAETST